MTLDIWEDKEDDFLQKRSDHSVNSHTQRSGSRKIKTEKCS